MARYIKKMKLTFSKIFLSRFDKKCRITVNKQEITENYLLKSGDEFFLAHYGPFIVQYSENAKKRKLSQAFSSPLHTPTKYARGSQDAIYAHQLQDTTYDTLVTKTVYSVSQERVRSMTAVDDSPIPSEKPDLIDQICECTLEVQTAKLEKAKEELSNRDYYIKTQEQKIEELNDGLEERGKSIQSLNTKVTMLDRQLTDALHQIKIFQIEKETYQKQLLAKEELLKRKEQEFDALKLRHNTLQASYEEFRANFGTQTAELCDKEETINAQAHVITGYENLVNSLQDSLAKHTKELGVRPVSKSQPQAEQQQQRSKIPAPIELEIASQNTQATQDLLDVPAPATQEQTPAPVAWHKKKISGKFKPPPLPPQQTAGKRAIGKLPFRTPYQETKKPIALPPTPAPTMIITSPKSTSNNASALYQDDLNDLYRALD